MCAISLTAFAEDNTSQPSDEEKIPAETKVEKPESDEKPAPQQSQEQEAKQESEQQPAEPAPEPQEKQSEKQEIKTEPESAPQEQQKQSPTPPQEPKWQSHLQDKHKPVMEWLEKNYPKRAERLKGLGNNDPEKFVQRMEHAVKLYDPILKAEKNNRQQLAQLLRNDVDLKIQRDQLLRQLPSAPEDQRQALLDELKGVVSARFDVIIQKKQLEYDHVRGRLDWLNKKLEEHGNELQKLKDEKDQSVEKRVKELVEGKIEIDWESL